MPETALAVLEKLRVMLADLDGYIQRRAEEIAAPLVAEALATATAQVGSAQHETERQRDLVAELRRRIGGAESRAERAAAIVERIQTMHWDMAACRCWVCEAARGAGLRPREEYQPHRDPGHVYAMVRVEEARSV